MQYCKDTPFDCSVTQRLFYRGKLKYYQFP
jgi:hypothetical protein